MSPAFVLPLFLVVAGHPHFGHFHLHHLHHHHHSATTAAVKGAECVDCPSWAPAAPWVDVSAATVVKAKADKDASAKSRTVLTSRDTPEIVHPVPYGPLEVEVIYPVELGQLQTVQLIINGKVVAEPVPSIKFKVARATYRFDNPPLGSFMVQARVLLDDGRWSAISQPIRLETQRPQAPVVIALADANASGTSPIEVPACIRSSELLVRFANHDPCDKIVASVDGRPAITGSIRAGDLLAFNLNDYLPGSKEIVFTRFPTAAGSLASEPSRSLKVLYQPTRENVEEDPSDCQDAAQKQAAEQKKAAKQKQRAKAVQPIVVEPKVVVVEPKIVEPGIAVIDKAGAEKNHTLALQMAMDLGREQGERVGEARARHKLAEEKHESLTKALEDANIAAAGAKAAAAKIVTGIPPAAPTPADLKISNDAITKLLDTANKAAAAQAALAQALKELETERQNLSAAVKKQNEYDESFRQLLKGAALQSPASPNGGGSAAQVADKPFGGVQITAESDIKADLESLAFQRSPYSWRIANASDDEENENGVNLPICSISFPDAAHFPDLRFGPRGETWEREGAVIYEGMKLTWNKEGQYEVSFVVEAPSMPTDLRLQLEIRHENTTHSLTLPPVRLSHSQSRTESDSYSWAVRQRGYCAVLKHCVTKDVTLSRSGTARFGFATTVETNQ